MDSVFWIVQFCRFLSLSDIQTNVDKSPKTQWRFVAFHWRSAELAIIISYPTSACEIIVLLKTPPRY